jgi:exonuclease SbcC
MSPASASSLRVTRMHLRSSLGLPRGLPPFDSDASFVVVLGPNASGKSTLARAILATLWPTGRARGMDCVSEWRIAGVTHSASLIHERCDWQPGPPPRGPQETGTRHAFGLGRLLREQSDDAELARRIAVEFAGGFDLDALQAPLRGNTGLSRSLHESWTAARGKRDAAIQRMDELSERESELSQLRDEDRRDQQLPAALELARALCDQAQLREELRALQAQLEELPPGLDAMDGHEFERLEELEERLHDDEETARAERKASERIAKRLQELSFDEEPPPAHELERRRTQAQRLSQVAEAQERLGADLRERFTELQAKQAILLQGTLQIPGRSHEPSEDDNPENPLWEAIPQLEEASQVIEELEQQLQAQDHRRRSWLGSRSHDPRMQHSEFDHEAELEQLRGALSAARDFLRFYKQRPLPGDPELTHYARLLFVLGLALLGLGIGLDVVWLTSIAALVLGLCLGLRIARLRAEHRNNRRGDFDLAARKLYEHPLAPEDRGRRGIAQWSSEIEERIVKVTLDRERCQRARDAEHELEATREKLEAAVQAREELCDELGIDPAWPALDTLAQLRTLAEWRDAREEYRKLWSREARARRELAEEFESLLQWAEGLGLEPPSDEREMTDFVAAVAQRVKDFEEQSHRDRERRGALDAALGRVAAGRAQIRKLLARAGVAHARAERDPTDATAQAAVEPAMEQAKAELQRRLTARARWAKLDALRSEKELLLRHLEPKLADLEPLHSCLEHGLCSEHDLEHPLEGSESELSVMRAEELVRDLEQRSEARSKRLERMGELKEQLEQARASHSLERSAAALESATTAIHSEAEQLRHEQLQLLLLEDARDAQRRSRAPELLRRAQERFAEFTHGQFELDVRGREQLEFVARDVRRQRQLELSALSDGTRIQLLLALRIAGIEQAEATRAAAPLLLDEALSTSDPMRFRTIAESLLRLAHEGRQVFYFSADPSEYDAWCAAAQERGQPAPLRVDLSQLRGQQPFWSGPSASRPIEHFAVPHPGDDDSASYARRLAVPVPDGFEELDAWHLLHLLPDHLDELHALLVQQITHVGQYRRARDQGRDLFSSRSQRQAGAAEAHAPRPRVQQLLDARILLLDALLHNWRIGRGRPLDWGQVDATGAVSAKFTERVRSLLDEHSRDAAAFVQAVGELPRFHKAKHSIICSALIESGHLDERPRLTQEELLHESFARAEAELANLAVEQRELHAFARRIVEQLDSA